MRRFTTPAVSLKVKGTDLTGMDHVYVTFRQGLRTLNIESSDLSYDGTDTTVTVDLTQQQTASFKSGSNEESAGEAYVQVNWTKDGTRDATVAKKVPVLVNLYERVIDD